MEKVEKTINKEESNKFVGVLPSWLENFIPHIHLTPQGLLVKPIKKHRLVFDAAFLTLPESTHINEFTKTEDEIDLECGQIFKKILKRICNLRMTHVHTEILLIDDDDPGAFRHVKFHSDIAGDHFFVIGKTLCVPLDSVFRYNVIPHNWEVINLDRNKLAEYL